MNRFAKWLRERFRPFDEQIEERSPFRTEVERDIQAMAAEQHHSARHRLGEPVDYPPSAPPLRPRPRTAPPQRPAQRRHDEDDRYVAETLEPDYSSFGMGLAASAAFDATPVADSAPACDPSPAPAAPDPAPYCPPDTGSSYDGGSSGGGYDSGSSGFDSGGSSSW